MGFVICRKIDRLVFLIFFVDLFVGGKLLRKHSLQRLWSIFNLIEFDIAIVEQVFYPI